MGLYRRFVRLGCRCRASLRDAGRTLARHSEKVDLVSRRPNGTIVQRSEYSRLISFLVIAGACLLPIVASR